MEQERSIDSSSVRPPDWLIARLPAVQPFRVRCEADFYGGSCHIAKATGRAAPPRSFSYWLHGPILIPDPPAEWLLMDRRLGLSHLVGNPSEEQHFRAAGYRDVTPVGAPFLYVEDPEPVQRMPGTLLVMPPHIIGTVQQSPPQARYTHLIAELAPRFNAVIACISPRCARQGLWCKDFERHGIPWITGAQGNDMNALLRMKRLFSSFEFMTTNTLGSHVPYAAACGARVSIFGPYWLEDHGQDPFLSKRVTREVLDHVLQQYSLGAIRERWPWLLSDPAQAPVGADWALELLGIESRRRPAEVAELLGWSIRGQLLGYPQWVLGLPRRAMSGFRLL